MKEVTVNTGQHTVAFIPARGGSTGLPKKNTRLLNGKPLFWYSIEFAKKCGIAARDIYVSSDDVKTLELAGEFGVNPVERPRELASDTSSMDSAVMHFLTANEQKRMDYILLLQPTNPLRHIDYYTEALCKIKADNFDCVLTVNKFHKKVGKFNGEGVYIPVLYNPTQRRQDTDELYFANGMIFLFSAASFRRSQSVIGDRYSAIVTDDLFGFNDIDTLLDFNIVEFLFTSFPEKYTI